MYKMNFRHIKIHFVIDSTVGVTCLDVSNGIMISMLLELNYDAHALPIKWHMYYMYTDETRVSAKRLHVHVHTDKAIILH